MGNIVVAGPNKAKIISGLRGTRLLVGQCGFALCCCEQSGAVSLEMITLTLNSVDAESARGVKISISAVAQVKLTGVKPDGSVDTAALTLAASHFMDKSQDEIDECIQRTLEGHQRQIIGTLTVEEIYKDRAAFSERVREHVVEDLRALGVTLASYTVTDIGDREGYMDALGATATAVVKREAEEGRARNQAEASKVVATATADADIATAESSKLAHNAKALLMQAMAEADRDLELKKARYAEEVNRAKEKAVAAGLIEKAVQEKEIVRETTEQKVEEARVMLSVTEQHVLQQQKELAGMSEAKLMERKNQAMAVSVEAEAEADRIRQVGKAEADATRFKGEAEAAVLRMRADAYKEFGEAALMQSVVEQLPSIAEAIAKPLCKTDKMVFVSQDGTAGSQLTKDITKIMADLPETVSAVSGLDVKGALQRLTGGGGGTAGVRV
eukprot:CAMPEP_0114235152 /NCGR_PEP_ID=MMETSP0058-20121206/6093_1 /TAXON_ID=36894 /ORGANISM="Pyramimonas parkeae, CCMP726" /LENGTH=442 /DNA_ID=CAMNT_0001346885 /DNA_START=119 /DNA_END=1447 /DNA_ORIENTATION=-